MDTLKLEKVEDDGTVVFSLFLGPEFLHVGGKESIALTFRLLRLLTSHASLATWRCSDTYPWYEPYCDNCFVSGLMLTLPNRSMHFALNSASRSPGILGVSSPI